MVCFGSHQHARWPSFTIAVIPAYVLLIVQRILFCTCSHVAQTLHSERAALQTPAWGPIRVLLRKGICLRACFMRLYVCVPAGAGGLDQNHVLCTGAIFS